jgi:hypothetical protein
VPREFDTTLSSRIPIWIALTLTVGLITYNVVTLGGLGFYLYAIGDGIADFILFGSLGRLHGDYYWPIAIWMGISWPIGAFVIWYALSRYWRMKMRPYRRCLLFVCALLVFDVLLSGAFHIGAAMQSADDRAEENRLVPAERMSASGRSSPLRIVLTSR